MAYSKRRLLLIRVLFSGFRYERGRDFIGWSIRKGISVVKRSKKANSCTLWQWKVEKTLWFCVFSDTFLETVNVQYQERMILTVHVVNRDGKFSSRCIKLWWVPGLPLPPWVLKRNMRVFLLIVTTLPTNVDTGAYNPGHEQNWQ